MSATFVKQLRSRRPPLELATAGSDTVSFRVQVAELWDAVQVTASPSMIVGDLKQRALEVFFPGESFAADYVLKLRGWEMLDETAPIGQSGVGPGAIVLVSQRRRRPIR
jgi:hypothetical protein